MMTAMGYGIKQIYISHKSPKTILLIACNMMRDITFSQAYSPNLFD